jgi:hypothetical protein
MITAPAGGVEQWHCIRQGCQIFIGATYQNGEKVYQK